MGIVAPSVTGRGAGHQARIGILTKVCTAELVDAATAKHDRIEWRRRLLPARLVMYLVLALCLFAREPGRGSAAGLTSDISGGRALAQVNRSSLCRARVRLGEDVLETVFRQVAGPLATEDTPGAWWRGLRLLALERTQSDLPDSTNNGDTFDGPSTTGDVPFGSPQTGTVGLPRGPSRDPPVCPRGGACPPGGGHRPGLLPEVCSHRPSQHFVPARND
ncbi:transposase domain-containing protein [Streptomyces sp.]|uniref:transposase domain-containing protein n=1 Tax=Streptomyces sp. TaxID=1931 RepID=UPI0039C96C2B